MPRWAAAQITWAAIVTPGVIFRIWIAASPEAVFEEDCGCVIVDTFFAA